MERGSGTTDGHGNYGLDLSGYTGQAVKLIISAGTGTTMIWDGPTGNGHTFGQAEAVPSGFSMQTILPSLSSSSVVDVPITPYTSMASALVEAANNKDASTINLAMARISALTGFDVAHTRALDVTDPTSMKGASLEEQRAGVMDAALTFIPGNSNIADLVTQLSQSVADGQFTANDPIQIGALTKAWSDALADSNISPELSDAVKNDVKVAAQTVNSETQGGTYGLKTPTLPNSDMDAAKGLINDTRSLVSNLIGTNFKSPLGAVGTQVEDAGALFDKDSAAVMQLLTLSIQQAAQQVGTLSELRDAVIQNGSVLKPIQVQDDGNTLGTLQLTASNPDAVKIQLSGSLHGDTTGSRTVTIDASIETGMNLATFNWTKLSTSQTSTHLAISASISDGTTKAEISKGVFTLNFTPGPTAIQSIYTSASMEELDFALTTPKGAFSGTASFDAVKMANATAVSNYFHEYDHLTLKKAALSGTFALTSGESFKASLGLDLSNAESFDLVAFLYGNDEVNWTDELPMSAADVLTIKSAAGISGATGTWSVSADSNYLFVYSDNNRVYSHSGNPSAFWAAYNPDPYVLNQFKANSNPTVLDHCINVTGKDDTATQGYVHWQIHLGDAIETGTNFLKLAATFNFEMSGIAGLPTTKVAISAERNALHGGDASIGFTWGTSQYIFTFSNVDIIAKTGSMTISNGQGVSLQLKDINASQATGTLYVGNNKVADVKQLSSGLVKVSYTDGTFETLQ